MLNVNKALENLDVCTVPNDPVLSLKSLLTVFTASSAQQYEFGFPTDVTLWWISYVRMKSFRYYRLRTAIVFA